MNHRRVFLINNIFHRNSTQIVHKIFNFRWNHRYLLRQPSIIDLRFKLKHYPKHI